MMSQLKVPVTSSLALYLLSLSVGLGSGQDESNRRVAYGILLANPMGASSSPYPVYQIPMQQMQQPYYGFGSGYGSGYPSASPMGWPTAAAAAQMQPYPAASYGHPAVSGAPGFPGQQAYFGQMSQMAGMSPGMSTPGYSGYSPLTMIGRILGASKKSTKSTDDVKTLEELIRML